jgi:hypothetical protein
MATCAARLVLLVIALACFALPVFAESVTVGVTDGRIIFTNSGDWREQEDGKYTFTRDTASTASFKFKGEWAKVSHLHFSPTTLLTLIYSRQCYLLAVLH